MNAKYALLITDLSDHQLPESPYLINHKYGKTTFGEKSKVTFSICGKL